MTSIDPGNGGSTRLSEVMATRLVTFSPEDTLRTAVEVLTAQGISGAPVVAGSTVVGVLSAIDILEFERSGPVANTGQLEEEARDREVPAEWLEGEESPSAYFLTLWEDDEAAVDERFRETSPDWDVLDDHTVAEAMSRRVWSLPPDATVQEASACMLQAGIHRVLVMDGARLVGVVSTTDVLRVVRPSDRSHAAVSPPVAGIRPADQGSEHLRGGFVFGPTDYGVDVGLRPGGAAGWDEW